MKGESGFLYHSDEKEKTEEAGNLEALKIAISGKNGSEILKNKKAGRLAGCFNGKGQRKECEEVFVGWFYETRIERNRDEKDCETKIYDDRSRVCGIAFVADQHLNDVKKVYEGNLSFKVYDNCGTANKEVSVGNQRCRLLGGTREQFINLWMNSGKFIPFPT